MDQVRRAYGVMAEQYIELFDDLSGVHADDLDLIERYLSMRPGVVLDVGCGPGLMTAHLCSRGVDAIGADLVPEFIHHARRAHPEGRFQLASMRRLPAPDGAFTGVLAWYSLIHVAPDELDAVLAELRRVTAPGGTLVAGFFDGERVTAFDHRVVTAHYWPADELSRRLHRAGFVEIDRQQRPGTDAAGLRPHAALVALAN